MHFAADYLRQIKGATFFFKIAPIVYMILLYRCLQCLEIFTSKESADKHVHEECVSLTLDDYLKKT